MGNQLDEATDNQSKMRGGPTLGPPLAIRTPWLDHRTTALIQAITAMVAEHPEIQAVILFGSVARHDERPLTDAQPSDVDLLLLVDPGPEHPRLPLDREVSLHMSLGAVSDRYREAPREVQVTLIQRDLAGWDPLFVANVARDGILLWSRGALPDALAPVAERLGRRA